MRKGAGAVKRPGLENLGGLKGPTRVRISPFPLMIDFVKDIALGAGKKICGARIRVVREKEGGGNWVTEADLVSESYILSAIGKQYPGHKILSEETLSAISDFESVSHLWIVDPLDGTTNATFDIPFYSVSIAYMDKGRVVAGAIYDPSRNELFWAVRGKGAFLNDQPIHIGEQSRFKGAVVDIGCPYGQEDFQKTYPLGEQLHALGARIVNLGSGALECAYVGCGRLSFYYEAGLKPWDIAAGSLIVEEAGGIMTSLKEPFSVFQQKEILVGNKVLVDKAKYKV